MQKDEEEERGELAPNGEVDNKFIIVKTLECGISISEFNLFDIDTLIELVLSYKTEQNRDSSQEGKTQRATQGDFDNF